VIPAFRPTPLEPDGVTGPWRLGHRFECFGVGHPLIDQKRQDGRGGTGDGFIKGDGAVSGDGCMDCFSGLRPCGDCSTCLGIGESAFSGFSHCVIWPVRSAIRHPAPARLHVPDGPAARWWRVRFQLSPGTHLRFRRTPMKTGFCGNAKPPGTSHKPRQK